MWLIAGITAAVLLQLPENHTHHMLVAYLLAGVGVVWGTIQATVSRWAYAVPWMHHLGWLLGLAGVGVAIWATGGPESQAWIYLLALSLYCCNFYRSWVAAVYAGLALLVQAAPLVYAPSAALHGHMPDALVITLAGDLSIGVALLFGKRLQVDRRHRAERQALTDPLTGLANHRELDRRLRTEVTQAIMTNSPLAVAVLDVDHFKTVNDMDGHDQGDETLVRLASLLRTMARSTDVLARSGGDEFTWVLPGATGREAQARTEALHEALSATHWSRRVTLSVGVADNSWTQDPAELVRLADGALYWSKVRGRNRSSVYDPEVIDALSAEERADRLERTQALRGLRALARAIDAKDPETREHAERVSTMSRSLALAVGWDEHRADLLAEAALVHDVGKIGIENRILHKRGALTQKERDHIKTHAELSARIVEGVLSEEQAEWIRTHHEWADGSGYPDGLDRSAIPLGGALLAVADAFDVMTAGRAYNRRRPPADALAEVKRRADVQFTVEAVAALEATLTPAAGALATELS
ncbi:MAG: diguanylate cyclase [Solirubrobacterales bacterium]|nr:diguanylate cyclase [Solirubrobacterales bacterium]